MCMIPFDISRETTLKLETVLNLALYPLTLLIEAAYLIRFYYMWDDYNPNELLMHQVVIGTLTPVIFVALYRATVTDPGRLPGAPIDSEEATGQGKNICKKCGATRLNEFVHHCSTCEACTENMDHHCTFIRQCVGRNNLKYFLQFCLYWFLILTYAFAWFVVKVYTDNSRRQVGVQGITYLILPLHQSLMFCFLPPEMGGYERLRVLDSFLLYVVLGFMFFAGFNGASVLIDVLSSKSKPARHK